MVIPPAPEQAVGGLGSTLPVTQDPTSNTFWSETAIIDAIRDANVKGIDPAVHLAQKKKAPNPT